MQHVAPPSNSIKSTRDVITWHAYMSGLKAGSVTGMVAGTAVLSANAYWPAFRTRLGVSGKTALALMPAMAVFSFVSENRMLAGARNPQMYLASTNPNFVELRVPKQSSLMMYVPACRQLLSLNTSIQRSQQIMHTRIYGQTAVVVLLLGSMAFSDYMKKRGRFEEVETDDE
ncbi:hypothetical protein PF005_g8424 [Phytophthora fragariae]|uniref:HIG1 domain-containing protein n=1 Tax=Phytophthora fragariae TaxID=53985 RepID=A0A6A3YHU5_9STRA|nr:hypothetical protein PF003_g28262 [Phytophthora fragariae]KAE8941102.1 hypothetical protein PF009_g9093 [Phytophthora fragariae]KAE9016712.1 hypothetical protein PF011_g7030 [Phytophthora fragariae]KAE9119882.1 hypothetical protein PF007_g8374 [Phytophthora fragariae]KAE9147975.1 hypothetical protein PF006_g7389 [Phytophthora fragariae]